MGEVGLPTGSQLVLSNRVNLDDLFGNVFDKAITEPVTSFKMAVYALVKTLHVIHEEYHRFTIPQANRLICIIYGLLELGDRPYVDIRRIARYMDLTVHSGILQHFLQLIHSVQQGNDLIIVLKYLITLNPRNGSAPQKLFQNRNFIFLWLRRLRYQWNRLTTQQIFDTNEAFRRYINGVEEMECSFMERIYVNSLPFEIEYSSRARKWIDLQMHYLQVCPSLAMNPEQMFQWTRKIKEKFHDVHHVHILEMLNHINLKNSMAAQESLRIFFDLSMFRPNLPSISPSAQPFESKRLGSIDQKPLRYGTLLLARIYRMFGDHKMARSLLTESVQQAQSQGDSVCLRLAMVELAAIDTMGFSKCRKNDNDNSTENNDVPLVTLDSVKSILQHEKILNDNENKFFDSDKDIEEFQHQLIDAIELLSAILAARFGIFGENSGGNLARSMRSTSADDYKAKSRLIADASTATLSSIRLHQGYWRAARTAALSLTEANGSDGIAPHHETEAYAIAGANIIYSYMAEGKWDLAATALTDLISKYPDRINWQAAHHVNICKTVFYFDFALRLGKWKEIDEKLDDLRSVCPDEAAIRQALLLSQRGELQTAEILLRKELQNVGDKPIVFKFRLQMQLSSVLSALQKLDDALDLLLSIIEHTKAKSLFLLTAMAQRRLAMFHASCGHNEQALSGYYACEESIEYMGSALEKCFYHLGCSEVKDAQNDPLYHLAQARRYCQQAGYPIIEKAVLKEIALHFHKISDIKRRDDICEQFVCMDEAHPGYMNWKLF